MKDMNFNSLLPYLTSDKLASLSSLIEEGYVSELHIMEILGNAIKLKKSDEQYGVRKAVNKLLYIFDFLKQSKIKENYNKMYADTIARLRKDNGDETVNEILSHMALTHIFPLYKIAPFFATMPDGYIVDADIKIPIEMKSRFPKIFETISDFADGIGKLRLEKENLDITFIIHINELKLFEKNSCSKEIKFNAENFNSVSVDALKIYPQTFKWQRKTQEIEYSVQLIIDESPKNRSIIVIPKNDLSFGSYYISKVNARVSAGEICPLTNQLLIGSSQILHLTLSNNVKESLAKSIIKRGINNATNLPAEPRIIVFYSTRFNEFAEKFSENYVNDRKDSMIVGINPLAQSFDEDNKFYFDIAVIKAGDNIKNIVKKYISNQDWLNT